MSRIACRLPIAACVWTMVSAAAIGQAAVAVIANRTAVEAQFSLTIAEGPARDFKIAADDNLTLHLDGSRRLVLRAGQVDRHYTLSPGSAYAVVDWAGGIVLRTIGLTDGLASPPIVLPTVAAAAPVNEATANAATANAAKAPLAGGATGNPSPAVVSVQILVDDDERASQPAWEKRLRARVAAASEILARDCGVRLQVASVGTWESGNAIQDFPLSLEEFERVVVPPQDVRLAIGFTSQYTLVRGEMHLGGIHGPLATHLLVREWSQIISEPERLEVLLHELGHFLGAAHSPESNSVMRPKLADRRARSVKFRIGFDPLNTLAMSLVGAQLATGDRRSLGELDLPVQLQLRPIHAELSRTLLNDPNPRRFLGLIDRGRVQRTIQAARAVVGAIEKGGAALAENAPPAEAAGTGPSLAAGADEVRSLDAATAALPDSAMRPAAQRFAIAAKVAARLPADQQTPALLLAVALTGPARSIVADHPLTRPMCDRISIGSPPRGTAIAGMASVDRRRERLLGSAAMASLLGPELAESAALLDCGLTDPKHPTVDLADYADRLAGIVLAERLMATAGRADGDALPNPGRMLERLLDRRQSDSALPGDVLPGNPIADQGSANPRLRGVVRQDAVLRADFERRLGSVLDPRFLAYRRLLFGELRRQLAQLTEARD